MVNSSQQSYFHCLWCVFFSFQTNRRFEWITKISLIGQTHVQLEYGDFTNLANAFVFFIFFFFKSQFSAKKRGIAKWESQLKTAKFSFKLRKKSHTGRMICGMHNSIKLEYLVRAEKSGHLREHWCVWEFCECKQRVLTISVYFTSTRFHSNWHLNSTVVLYRIKRHTRAKNAISVRNKTITQTYPQFTGCAFLCVSISSSKTMIEPISEYHAIMSSTKTWLTHLFFVYMSVSVSFRHFISLALFLSVDILHFPISLLRNVRLECI